MSKEIQEYTEAVQVAIIADVMERQIAGDSVKEACAKSDISKSTFYRWLKEGAATGYFESLRDSRMKEMDLRIAGALPRVIDNLVNIATGDKEQRGANPIQAAKLLMQIIGVNQRGNVGSVDADALAALSRVPNFIQFNIHGGKIQDEPAEEVIEGEIVKE